MRTTSSRLWVEPTVNLIPVGSLFLRFAACLMFVLASLTSVLQAQSYLTSTGSPSFAAPYPVEMGTVDAASGNLHLEIPLGSFSQRGAGALVPKLLYDSHIWMPVPDGTVSVWTTQGSQYGLAFGTWGFIEGGNSGVYYIAASGQGCNADYMLWSDAGVKHFFNIPGTLNGSTCSGGTAYAVDSSGYQIRQTAWNNQGLNATISVYAPDGTEVWGTDLYSQGIAAKDSNGNYLGLTSATVLPPGINNPVIDTLGRKIAAPVAYGNPMTIQVPNSQGTTSNYVVTTTAISVNTNFQEPGVLECNSNCTVTVISSVGLPDGTSYTFLYDCLTGSNPVCNSPASQTYYYGTLTGMTMPSGEAIAYNYSMFGGVSWGSSHNEYPSRWVTSKTTSQGTWTYTPLATAGAGPQNICLPGYQVGCLQTTVTRPDGSSEITSFIVDPYGGSWPQRILSYDTNGTTLLSTVTNTWDFSTVCTLNICNGLGYQDVRKLSTSTTVPIPGGNLTKQTTLAYDSPQTGNLTAVSDWRYQSGTNPTFPPVPDRATYITYHASTEFDSPNIIDRPFTVAQCNNTGSNASCPGGGNLVALRSLTYDNYGCSGCGTLPLSSVTGIENHDDTNFGVSHVRRGNLTNNYYYTSSTTAFTGQNISFDTTGQVIQTTDFNTGSTVGNPTSYSYADKFFNDTGSDSLSSYTPPKPTNSYVTSTTDAIGTMTFGYYYGSGQIAESINYDAVATYSHYMDLFDRPTQTDYPIGWVLNQYHVPVQGQTEVDSYEAVADTTGSSSCTSCVHTQAILDPLGRAVKQNLVNNPAGEVSISSAYDGLNRIVSSSHPNFGPGDPNDVMEAQSYDGLSRTLKVVHPDGQSAQMAYGPAVTTLGGVATQQGSTGTYGYGFPIVSLDEAGNLRQEWVDGFGQVIEVDEHGSGSSVNPTYYTYDVLGNLTSVTEGAQVRTWQYDGLSRLTGESTPEGGTISISYFTTGIAVCSGNPDNPCSKTAPAPNQSGSGTVTTTYTYDSANRLKQKTHSDSTGTETYTYKTGSYGKGLLSTMKDPSGSESYQYSKNLIVTSVTKVSGGTTYSLGYGYNAGNLLTKLVYPSGRSVFYNYDKVGHLCQVATTSSTSACNAATIYLSLPSSQYDAAGRPLSATYGNGIVATAAYDPNSVELTNLSYAKGGATLFGLKYYYQKDSTNCPTGNAVGNNGQIQCILDTVQPGRSGSYTYDGLGRLLSANTTGSTQYPVWGLSETYDRYGNRTTQTVTAGSGYNVSLNINPANNQISTFTYDAPGNIISEPTPTLNYAYDAEECNTAYSGNGSAGTYTCDGNHLRVQKVVTGVGAVSTVYIRSGGQVVAEYDNGAAVASPTREYIYGNNLLATVTGSTGGSGGTIIYQQRDHLSPRLFTDVNGNDVGEQGTFPFGEPWYTSSESQGLVFTSYERDAESGNDYALARSYASTDGRFLSPDPLEGVVGDPQSWNRYAYVENDPINLSDPGGQGWWDDFLSDIESFFTALFAGGGSNLANEGGDGNPPCGNVQCVGGIIAGFAVWYYDVDTGEWHKVTPGNGNGPIDVNAGSNGPPQGGPGAGTTQDSGASSQGPNSGGATTTASGPTPSPGGGTISNPSGGGIWNENPGPTPLSVPVAMDIGTINRAFSKSVALMNARGQRFGKGTLGGTLNQFKSDYDMLTKGVNNTNRVLGCEDQCNQLQFALANLKTNSGYTFQNVVSHEPPLFLRHVTVLGTPALGSGAPLVHLDPLYNTMKIDW